MSPLPVSVLIILCLCCLPAVATERELCDRFLGFAGDEHSSFQIIPQISTRLDMGEAVVLVLTAGQSSGILTAKLVVMFDSGGRPETLESNAAGVVTIDRSLPAGTQISVLIMNQVPSEPAPFAFYSYVSNSRYCFVKLNAHKLVIPLVSINNFPAVVPLSTLSTAPYFQLTVQSTSSVPDAFYSTSNNMTTHTGYSVSSGYAEGLWPFQSTMYILVDPKFAYPPTRVVLCTVYLSWSTPPPGYTPKPPVTAAPTTLRPVSTESHAFGTFVVFCFYALILYFVLRSAMNYKNGIRTFPEYIPHHEMFVHCFHSVQAIVALRQRHAGSLPVRNVGDYETAGRSQQDGGE